MTTYVDATGITVDTVPLNTVAKAVETKTGRMKVAAARGANAVVAGRSGSIWTPGKPSEEGRIVLPMYVLGCDDDGLIPGGSSALKEFYKNKDLLQRVFSKRYALLDVQQTQADGTVRQCYAEVTAEIDFEMFNEQDARVTYELLIPSVYWRDNADITQASSAITASGTTFNLSSFLGGTAPMEEMTILLDVTAGTISNPRLTDPLTGYYVQLNATLDSAGTKRWRVNSATWGSRKGDNTLTTSADGTSTNAIGTTVRSGDNPRLLAVTPTATTGSSSLVLIWTGSTGSPSATVTAVGRRKYHS